MRSRLKCFMLSLAIGIFTLAAHAQKQSHPKSPDSTVLLHTDHAWDGTKYGSYPAGQPELTILKIDIPPHTTLPWHKHPMPNAAYVISGTLYVESKDGKRRITLHAGDVLPEMVGTVHRGWTGESAVQLIAFYAGVKGMPTRETAP